MAGVIVLEELEQDVAVGFFLLFAGAAEDERVGGGFPVDAHAAKGVPEHRVEPVEYL